MKNSAQSFITAYELGLFDPAEAAAEATAALGDLDDVVIAWGVDRVFGAPRISNDGVNVVIEDTSYVDRLVLEDPDPTAPGTMRLRNLDDGSEVLVFANPTGNLTINLGNNVFGPLAGADKV